MAEPYQIGKTYKLQNGSYGIYRGGNMFEGVENPNKASEEQARLSQLGDLWLRLYGGDKTVIPQIEKLSGTTIANNGYNSYIGDRRTLDSLIQEGMIGNPQNYQTQRAEAQKYGIDAVNNAKAYEAALQAAGGDKTKLSAQGIAARGNVIKALKKEIATLGQGGYNDVDEESFESLMQDLASGKFVPNSMLPIDKTYKQRRAESIANTGVINRPTSNVYSSPVSSKQPATTKTNTATSRQYNPLTTQAQGYIVSQKAPASTKQTPIPVTNEYNPSVIKSKMTQAIQQPTPNQSITAALKQKGWVNKKII